VLIIFFFLADSWSTFIISLSLPISLIATFFFMGQAGVSLNVMSLGGSRSPPAWSSTIRSSCSRTSRACASRAWVSSRPQSRARVKCRWR
jgi:Cation/multidrug efflux pump